MAKNKNAGKARNYVLESGVYRFGKSKTYHKKAIYKFLKKKTAKKPVEAKPRFIEKPIGGAKNGGKRLVRVKRLNNDVPTTNPIKKGTSKNFFARHARSLRPTITPGTVGIILAGVHKGKRVIVLKQLASGLLLITGPMNLNGCPMRRINQIYLLATSTHVDIKSVKVPESINDDYFRRVKLEAKKGGKKPSGDGGDIFTSKKEEYKPSEQRKTDQAALDKQVMGAINKHPEASMLKPYLKHVFSLSKGQYPHKLAY